MSIKLLGEPQPQINPHSGEPPSIPVASINYLPKPEGLPTKSVCEVFEERITRRNFGPLSLEQLSALLWLGLKSRRLGVRGDGSELESCPLPSAGGCNALRVLVVSSGDPEGISIYESRDHSLLVLHSEVDAAFVRRQVANVLNPEYGTILLFAVDYAKLSSRYKNPESLGWRDSGVVLGGLAIGAEALGLNFCPLGFSAQGIVSSLLSDDSFFGAGGCVVGSRLPWTA